MIQKNRLEYISNFLTNKSNVNIEFIDNACPSTDGKNNIVLPSNISENKIIDILAMLLHETGHINYTRLTKSQLRLLNSEIFNVLNLLEDIRTENKTLKKYKQVKNFFKTLINNLIKDKKDLMLKENLYTQILKSIYLKSCEIDFINEEVKKAYEDLKLDEYINIAKKEKSTGKLIPVAIELREKIYNYIQEKKQDEIFNDTENGKLKELKDIIKEKITENEEEEKKLQEELQKTYQEENNLDKKESEECQALSNAKNQTEKESIQKEIESLKAKKISNNIQSNKIYTKINSLSNNKRKLEKIINSDIDNFQKGISLSGINALNEKDLIDKDIQTIKFKRSTESLLREILENRSLQKEESESGRINNKKLYKIFNNEANIFQTKEELTDYTIINFLLDNSGSMYGTRQDILLNVIDNLSKTLQKLSNEDLNIKFSIHSFNDTCKEIKSIEKDYSKSLFNNYRSSGCTRIFNAIDITDRKLLDIKTDNQKLINIIITDGNILEADAKLLRNNISSEIKHIYLGIMLSNNAREIFGKYSIDNLNNLDNALASILKENI